jgi:hypothetical protein
MLDSPSNLNLRCRSADARVRQRQPESHGLGHECEVERRGDPVDAAGGERVVWLVDLAEHKRRQQRPGSKITTRALRRDRRVPAEIAAGGWPLGAT